VTALYLYCIVKSVRKPSLAGVPPGLPDATRPEVINVAGSLWLVAAEVPLDTYGTGHLDRRLADMEWVGRIALAHEAVVEAFSRRPTATVIPMKLFTMFTTRERAVADVNGRRHAIDVSMRRIAGAEEWGVRIMRGEPIRTVAASGSSRSGSGAAFLAAKKKARDAANASKRAATDAALGTFRTLSRLARDARHREDAPGGAATPPLLDAAFLVPSAKRSSFTRTARREAAACARAGAQMTLSGPWPAYNFVQTDDPAK
jgi:hypothetical protein